MPAKKVLVCPMDWGLGHASRDIFLIEQLIKSGFEVILGSDKAPLLFLRSHFPELPFVVMPSYIIKYQKKGSLVLKMIFLLPGIIKGILNEHRLLKEILKSDPFDIIISDNRYGLWHKSVHCIFITHQLNIQTPVWLKWTKKLIRYVNYWFIKKFDECWIPDFEGTVNLAGILSHPKKLPENACFIGPLSHLNLQISKVNLAPEINSDYDILLILSGPEPQRSILEKNLLEQLITTSYSCLIVKGKPLENSFARSAKISIISHLNSSQLARLIVKTPVVISRSGYSTIMDMISLKKSAILIPTPGQTEQEYLAQYVMKNKWFYCVSQDKFNLESAIKGFKDFLPDNFPQIESTLDKRLRKLI